MVVAAYILHRLQLACETGCKAVSGVEGVFYIHLTTISKRYVIFNKISSCVPRLQSYLLHFRLDLIFMINPETRFVMEMVVNASV